LDPGAAMMVSKSLSSRAAANPSRVGRLNGAVRPPTAPLSVSSREVAGGASVATACNLNRITLSIGSPPGNSSG
jgi:hypothetical protein